MSDAIQHGTSIEFAANGLACPGRVTNERKPMFGGFTGVVVSIASGRLYVTEKNPRSERRISYDLGPAVEVTVTAQRLMVMLLVTLVGNGHTYPVKMNSESARALRSTLSARHTEDRTSRDAASVVQAIERFSELLSRGVPANQEPATDVAKLLGAA
jgi:hypothetical protein